MITHPEQRSLIKTPLYPPQNPLRLITMCRLSDLYRDIDPAYRDEEGGAPEDYEYEEETATESHQQPLTRTHDSPSFFPQEFINNSQMAYLIIKRQLMLLIHANYCSKIDNMFPDRSPCNMQSCDVFKGVLEHLKDCPTIDCETPRCVSSRNILRHYCNCYTIDCHICFWLTINTIVYHLITEGPW